MKKLAVIVSGLGVLLVVGLLVARHLAIGFLTPEFLVLEIEKQWNCRAEIEDLKVKLLGKAGIELAGVRLGYADQYIKKKTPYQDRPSLDDAAVSADFARVEVELKDLLKHRISIRQLLIKDVTVITKIRRDGKAKVQQLFQSPDRDNDGQESTSDSDIGKEQDSIAEGGSNEISLSSLQAEEDKGQKKFNAGNMELSTFAENVEIQNGKIVATMANRISVVTLSDFQLKLSQIEIDPVDLLKHNHAAFSFSGDLAVENQQTEIKQISMSLSGDGEVQPFDPSSGRIDPRWVSNLTIKKGSALNTFPLVEKLQELLSGVDTAGVNLDDLQLRGELVEDAATRIAGHAGKFELKKRLALPLPDTAFVFAAGGWLDSGNDQHQLLGTVMASDELTAKLTAKVDTYLRKKTKNFYSEGLTDLVLQPAMRDGRIAFDFVSKGNLGKPEVDILTPFGSLNELIKQGKETLNTLKDVGKSLLKSLIEK